LKIGIKTALLGLAAAAVIAKPGFSFASGLKGTNTTVKQNSTSFTEIVSFGNDDSGGDNSGIVTHDQPQPQAQQQEQDENNQPQVDEQQNSGGDQQSITNQSNGDDQSSGDNSSDDEEQ